MFIEKIEQNLIKINFYSKDEDICVGELIKVVYSGINGVLVQVIQIQSPENNQNYNTATAKIIFTIDNAGKIKQWQGNVPGNDFIVSKTTAHEVLSIIGMGEVPNPIALGSLSSFPETGVNIEASFLENPSIIVGDKETPKNNLLKLLAEGLSAKQAKVVIVDFNGDFLDLPNAQIIIAGKDFKLPLDLVGLENLYKNTLSGASVEIRANIENVFSEIETYLSSGEVSYIPFLAFMEAVNVEYQQNKTAELSLLSNSLYKLQQKEIFANQQKDVTAVFRAFESKKPVILNLSEIPKQWQAKFVDALIRLNTEKFKGKFFLLIDIDKITDFEESVEIAEKLLNDGFRGGIKPVFSLGHESALIDLILPKTENIFVFSAQNSSKIVKFEPFFAKLNQNEVIAYGKITNNVVQYIKLLEITQINDRNNIFNTENLINQPEIILNQQYSDIDSVNQNVSQKEHVIEPEKPRQKKEYYEEAVGADLSVNPHQAEPDEDAQEEEYYEEAVGADLSVNPHQAEPDEDAQEEESYEEEQDNVLETESEENQEEEGYNDNSSDTEEPSEYEQSLKLLLDDDSAQEHEHEETAEGDGGEDYDYDSSSEEFQDESALDYVNNAESKEEDAYSDENDESEQDDPDNQDEEQTASSYEQNEVPAFQANDQEFSDEDLKNFMDDEDVGADLSVSPNKQGEEEYEDEEESEYDSSEEFQDESALDYVESEESEEQEYEEEESEAKQPAEQAERMPGPPSPNIPVYNVSEPAQTGSGKMDLQEGDTVIHKKYGVGVIKKIIGYSEKKLCSIQFENVGRRLLDPRLAELEKAD